MDAVDLKVEDPLRLDWRQRRYFCEPGSREQSFPRDQLTRRNPIVSVERPEWMARRRFELMTRSLESDPQNGWIHMVDRHRDEATGSGLETGAISERADRSHAVDTELWNG